MVTHIFACSEMRRSGICKHGGCPVFPFPKALYSCCRVAGSTGGVTFHDGQ